MSNTRLAELGPPHPPLGTNHRIASASPRAILLHLRNLLSSIHIAGLAAIAQIFEPLPRATSLTGRGVDRAPHPCPGRVSHQYTL